MKLLFFVTKSYSLSILKPIDSYCKTLNDLETAWFIVGKIKNNIKGTVIRESKQVFDFNPDAIIVPGNVVPDFWPGLKVQIFHGLCEEKKGHYKITGFFDLYCTPGPLITEKFEKIKKEKNTFLVKETGWPKLDDCVNFKSISDQKTFFSLDSDTKVILYAPTFSPKYRSSGDLFEQIKKTQDCGYHWVVKFHELEKKKIIRKYKELISSKFTIIEDNNILLWLNAADLLITDTSSVAYEFLIFDRPIITYNTTTRFEKGINITDPDDLTGAITRSFNDPEEYSESRQEILNDIHPYLDGKSSERLIQSINETIDNGECLKLKKKSLNWFRKWKIRRLIS